MNLDLTREGLGRHSRRAAELFTEIYGELESRRVDPGVSRSEVRALLSGTISDDGVGLDQALNEFAEMILPNSMGTPHPLYLGLVNSSPLPGGPIADLLLSALNNNGGSVHQSPAFSAAEAEVVREFGRLCGFDDHVSGMILPGGTFANLQGLLLARHKHFPQWLTEGPTSLDAQPRVYRSNVTHFCNDRSLDVLGIGRRGMVPVASDGRGVVDPRKLEIAIEQDRNAGHQPFAVIANAGTTATGAIDEIDALADICARHEIWLHVDACYGGGALLAKPPVPQLQGIARADSVAIDPHKWFFIPMTAGVLLTPHRQLEREVFEIAATYIPDDEEVDPLRRGLPTSRRSSGFTVWMALRAHGWNVIRESVERNIALTRYLEDRLTEVGFRVLPDGQLSIACARWEPEGVDAESTDQIQTKIVDSVIATGRAWFSTVQHQGVLWLRFNMVNIHTRQHHIDELVELLKSVIREC